MDEADFEGSLVLERLAEIGAVDEFLAAVDSDDFAHAAKLMRSADVDDQTIDLVLQKMRNSDAP